jgi:hypothetical protein
MALLPPHEQPPELPGPPPATVLRGVFYNSAAAACSIHECGKSVFEVLKNSAFYQLAYSEANNVDSTADFVVVNYHHAVCRWFDGATASRYRGQTFCVVTEVSWDHSNILWRSAPHFHHHLVLDPTIQETATVHAFPRPLTPPINTSTSAVDVTCPVIGSFGFATAGKQWAEIVKAVQRDYDVALVRFNIPHATYVPDNVSAVAHIRRECEAARIKPGVRVEITSLFMSATELGQWCSENTLNCFFYRRENILRAGLAAVTDQAVASGRPLLVTRDKTFRHVLSLLKPYPEIGIKEAIETTAPLVKQLQCAWAPQAFLRKFEQLVRGIKLSSH